MTVNFFVPYLCQLSRRHDVGQAQIASLVSQRARLRIVMLLTARAEIQWTVTTFYRFASHTVHYVGPQHGDHIATIDRPMTD